MKNCWIGLKLFLFLAILTGLIYPLVITGIGKIFFPRQAGGSLIKQDEQVIGSSLIGQEFTSAGYFWGRPSFSHYQPLKLGASQLGWTSKDLQNIVLQRLMNIQTSHPHYQKVPAELLYASGSGLDPHISLETALFQLERVMQARHIPIEKKQEWIDWITTFVEGRDLGFLGPKYLNVFFLNQEMDQESRFARENLQ